MFEPTFWFRTGVCATHLELLQLLQDHVVRHVVEEPVSGGQDDVTQLDVEGRAICRVRAAGAEIAKSGREQLGLASKRLRPH